MTAALVAYVFRCPLPIVAAFAFNAVTVAQLEVEDAYWNLKENVYFTLEEKRYVLRESIFVFIIFCFQNVLKIAII